MRTQGWLDVALRICLVMQVCCWRSEHVHFCSSALQVLCTVVVMELIKAVALHMHLMSVRLQGTLLRPEVAAFC